MSGPGDIGSGEGTSAVVPFKEAGAGGEDPFGEGEVVSDGNILGHIDQVRGTGFVEMHLVELEGHGTVEGLGIASLEPDIPVSVTGAAVEGHGRLVIGEVAIEVNIAVIDITGGESIGKTIGAEDPQIARRSDIQVPVVLDPLGLRLQLNQGRKQEKQQPFFAFKKGSDQTKNRNFLF